MMGRVLLAMWIGSSNAMMTLMMIAILCQHRQAKAFSAVKVQSASRISHGALHGSCHKNQRPSSCVLQLPARLRTTTTTKLMMTYKGIGSSYLFTLGRGNDHLLRQVRQPQWQSQLPWRRNNTLHWTIEKGIARTKGSSAIQSAIVGTAVESRSVSSSLSLKSSSMTLNTPIHTFDSMQDVLEFLEDLPSTTRANNNDMDDALEHWYVVKYYVSYCKVCQRSALNYKKIALEYANGLSNCTDNQSVIHFLRADATSWATGTGGDHHDRSSRKQRQRQQQKPPQDDFSGNMQQWLKQMGLVKFPFVQIYRGSTGTCVASFSTGGTSYMFTRRVRETLHDVLQRTTQEWSDFEMQWKHDIDENRQARRESLSFLLSLSSKATAAVDSVEETHISEPTFTHC